MFDILKTTHRGFMIAKQFIKVKSPEILMAGGIIAVGAGVVSACKATRKVDTINKDICDFEIRCAEAIGKECEDGSVYSEEDGAIDIRNERILGTWRKIKAYSLSILLLGAGITSIIFSHKILKNRFDGILTAYEMVSSAYACYRQRVAEKYGKDEEFAIYEGRGVGTKFLNSKGMSIDNDKDANIPYTASAYQWTFGPGNPHFTTSNTLNAAFLIRTRNAINQKIWTNGAIYLDEVLEAFGIKYDERFKNEEAFKRMTRVCGWVDGLGDGAIDLGRQAEEFIKAAATNTMDSTEPIEVTLDFNCTGDIVNTIWPKKAVNKYYSI